MIKLLKNKKGSSGGTDGDAGISTSTTLTFIRVILISTIIVFLLILSVSSFIDSKAPVPVDLDSDLMLARLANVCLASVHQPFDIVDQKVILDSSLTLENIKNCFIDLQSTKIKKISLQWKNSSGLQTKTINVSFNTQKSQNIPDVFLDVLVKHGDGTISPGTLAVFK